MDGRLKPPSESLEDFRAFYASVCTTQDDLDLPEEPYFVAQGVYRGWALFGFVLCGALIANLTLAVMLREQRAPFWLALAAFALIAVTLAVFFAWTYPANQATSDWTVAPDDWRELRVRWEYLHAVNAVLTFVALCSATRRICLRWISW